MGRLIDITNQIFGNWTVIGKGSYTHDGYIQWICRCKCGTIKEMRGKILRKGDSKGCRNCQINRCFFRHGHARSPTYRIWAGIIARCHNPKDTGYKWYGAKGIKVCEEWRQDFLNFYKDMGERPKGQSIDRIDNLKDYCPDNCRWATLQEQNWNKRSCSKIDSIYNGWKILELIPHKYKAKAQCVKCQRIVIRQTSSLKKRSCPCPPV